jgi:dienelactone hydrolase
MKIMGSFKDQVETFSVHNLSNLKVPESVPLDLHVVSEKECEFYNIKLLKYRVYKDEFATAYVLFPKGFHGKLCGVLAIHGEGRGNSYRIGKSSFAIEDKDNKLALGAEICKKGNVVICPDRFPYESRSAKDNDNSYPKINDYYRMLECNKLLYDGVTELGKEIKEMSIAVDILTSFKEVDANKISVIGVSEGGFLGAMSLCFDDRIKAGCAINIGYMLNENKKEMSKRKRSICDMFLSISENGNIYDGLSEILASAAPKPFIWFENEKNISKSEVDGICERAKENYLNMRIPNKFISIIYVSSMFLPNDIKEKAYHWLGHIQKNNKSVR